MARGALLRALLAPALPHANRGWQKFIAWLCLAEMISRFAKISLAAIGCGLAFAASLCAEPTLESGWQNPPNESRLRAYWWWLNGNVTKASITRDLEQMQAKGFGGALLCDANGASQDGNDTTSCTAP